MDSGQFLEAFRKLETALIETGESFGLAEDRKERRQRLRAEIRYRTLLIFNDLVSGEKRELVLAKVRKAFSGVS